MIAALSRPELAFVVSTLLTVATTVLGLAVTYIAYRGYRRNDSRPMLFVSIGFALTFFGPFALFLLFRFAPVLSEFAFGVLGEVSRFLGLVSILYGLRMPLGER